MTEIVLNCPRVVPIIGELVAAGMPEHVAVDQEREARSLAGTGNHPLIARHAQWRSPLGAMSLTTRLPKRGQCPQFTTAGAMSHFEFLEVAANQSRRHEKPNIPASTTQTTHASGLEPGSYQSAVNGAGEQPEDPYRYRPCHGLMLRAYRRIGEPSLADGTTLRP
jgi:hypothetical protein